MLLTEPIQPFQFGSVPISMDNSFSHPHSQSYSQRRPLARSMSSYSSTTTTATSSQPLRLADVAKQSTLAVHVENWREDMVPVRQYLPMQHIIGSLKRDRDQKVQIPAIETTDSWLSPSPSVKPRRRTTTATAAVAKAVFAASPQSDDSFSDMLRESKRRRTSDICSPASSASSDPDRRFSYQATEHVPKEIPAAALPGLNMALNLASITANERDIFSEYAPKHLDDSQLLMNEVLNLREQMMDEDAEGEEEEEEEQTVEAREGDDVQRTAPPSPIITAERDAEVRRAFESFVDLERGHRRFIAKI